MSAIIYVTIFLIMGLFIYASIRERAKVRTRNYIADLPDPSASPFSKALANLIGTAGGIYLSLIMMITFLDIQMADKVIIAGIYIEPLAGLSIFMALIQPFVLKLYYKIKYRF